MTEKNKIAIKILGQEHCLISTDSPEYVEKVAKIVDERMNTILKSNSALSHTKIGVLTALNLADDLTQARQKIEELKATQKKPKADISETRKKVVEMTKKITESELLYTSVLKEFDKVSRTRNEQIKEITDITDRLETVCGEFVDENEALKNAIVRIAVLEKKLALRESEIAEYIKVFDELENEERTNLEEEFLEEDDYEEEIIFEGEIEEN